MAIESKYSRRGVSSSKEDVHSAIKNIDKGLYPKAFCKIVPDLLGGDKIIVILCILTGQAQNHHSLIFTGKKPATFRYGKELHRMQL